MSAVLTVVDVFDPDGPGRRIGLVVSAFDRSLGVSNLTDSSVRVMVGGEERVLRPSPRRRDCLVVGILLWRVGVSFDFRAVGEAYLDEPVVLDALCAELLLPGGAPAIH